MSPEVVLATLERLGGRVDRVYVVGCQPACLDEGIGLSPPVAAAVEGAVATVPAVAHRHPATRRKGDKQMIVRFVAAVALALIAALVVKSLPDIARYLKIREM